MTHPPQHAALDVLVAQLEEELADATDAQQEQSMRCRLALLHWDLYHDTQAAGACLAGARDHPLAQEFTRQLLLTERNAAAAAELLEASARAEGSLPAQADALLIEAARLRLFWQLDGEAAAKTCRLTRDLDQAPLSLLELYELALGVAGDAEGLVEFALGDFATLPTLLAGANALGDQLDRSEEAIALLHRAYELDDSDPYVLERLLEAEALFPQRVDRLSILHRESEILLRHAPRSIQAAALGPELAHLWGRHGAPDRAQDALARVDRQLDPHATEAKVPPPFAWGAILVALGRRALARQAHDYPMLAETYLELAKLSDVPPFSRAYRLRAAQIGEIAGQPARSLVSLLEANLSENPEDHHTSAMLQRLLLQQKTPQRLIALYEKEAELNPDRKAEMLRRAATIADGIEDDRQAVARLRRDAPPDGDDRFRAGDLQRLYREVGDEARLVDAYRRDADAAEGDDAALYWGVIAALQLRAGHLRQAATSAREALDERREDALALGILATIHRLEGDDDALRDVLTEASAVFQAKSNRAFFLRERARVANESQEALRLLEQARQLQPDDTQTLLALARLYESTLGFAEAVKIYQRLAEMSSDPADAAASHLEVGRIYERELDNPDAAATAYSDALRHAPGNRPAALSLVDLHQRRGDLEAALPILEQQLNLPIADDERSALQLRLAETLACIGRAPDEIIEAHVAALRSDPQRDDALMALERICRQHQAWDVLAAALNELPERTMLLDVRADALQQLGRFDDLICARNRLLELATDDADRADRAYDCGRAHEQSNDIETAIRCYQQAVDARPGHRPSLRALHRIYQADGRLEPLRRVLHQQLDAEDDPARRAELLLDLGHCTEHLGEAQRAAGHYEEALQLDPGNRRAFDALEQIYQTGRPLDLARLLADRATGETTPEKRSAQLLRAARIFEDHEHDDEAFAALDGAFRAAPGNRAAFTALESHCYQHERWREAMEMYDEAVRYVGEGGHRAYRLADLHSRRGQLQLMYLGQPGEAAASYLKALEQDPKSESAMKMLQNIFVHQQDWVGLIGAYEHRAHLTADNELFRLESLRQAARLASGHLPPNAPETLRLWRELYDADPSDDEAAVALEHLYQRHERHADLADLLEARLAEREGDVETLDGRRRLAKLVEQELEDPERAARAYEGIRRISEHDEEALRELARIYEATAQWEACISVLKDQIMIEADGDERSLLYFKCGSILEARFGDERGAIEHYQLSLQQSQGCLPAVHGLRDLYLRRGDITLAIETLEREFRLWDGEAEQAGVLARIAELRWRELGDRKKAIEEFEDALAIDSDCQPAMLSLFELYRQDHRIDQALALAERLAPRLSKGGDPQIRSLFFGHRGALIAERGNDPELAAESLVVALELDRRNLHALRALTALCRQRPDAYDFATIFRDLEQRYRQENDVEAVAEVLVAAGALYEIAADADAALERYAEAQRVAPNALGPLRAHVELLIMLRRAEDAISRLESFIAALTPGAAEGAVAEVLLGDLWADVEMDADRAAQTYAKAFQARADSDVGYRLAQQLYVLGQLDEAQQVMERVIALAQDQSVHVTALARYHHYLGVVMIQTLGSAEAAKRFRRALQIDPACAVAAQALARHLLINGDREAAEELLTHTLHETKRRGWDTATVELQRSIGGLLLGAGLIDQATQTFETIVASGRADVEDYLALAELYADQPRGISRAIDALQQLLDREMFNPHVFSLLAELYERRGDLDRTAQVLQVMELLGLTSAANQTRLHRLRRLHPWQPTKALDDRLRQATSGPLLDLSVERMWRVVASPLERVFPPELPSKTKPQPVDQAATPEARLIITRCQRLLGVKAGVYAASDVPGSVIAEGNRVVIDRLLLERPVEEIAFAVGRTLELFRSGHALISRLAVDDRLLLVELMNGLLAPADQRSDLAEEFIRRLQRKVIASIDEASHDYQAFVAGGGEPDDASRWLASIDRRANNHGLLCCDHIAAALRMSARLSGQELALDPSGAVAIRAIADGPELVQFYLAETYVDVRRHLSGA